MKISFTEYLSNHIHEAVTEDWWIKDIKGYPNLISHLKSIDDEAEKDILDIRKQQDIDKEEIRKYLVGKQLKVKASTDFDNEVKEYNLYIDNDDFLFFGGTGKLVWKPQTLRFAMDNPKAKLPKFIFRVSVYVREILEIKDYVKDINPNDPYDEEEWNEK